MTTYCYEDSAREVEVTSEMIGDNSNESRLGFAHGQVGKVCAIAILMLGVLLPAMTTALPADPQRPFDATDCNAAKVRLGEALLGSPLISNAEIAQVLAVVRDGTERLCGPDVTQKVIDTFNVKKIERSK